MFKQLDQVVILKTSSIRWMSAPKGNATTPDGIWTVIGVVDTDLVISKDTTIIRIPYTDAKVVASYSLEIVKKKIGEMNGYQEAKQKRRGRKLGQERFKKEDESG